MFLNRKREKEIERVKCWRCDSWKAGRKKKALASLFHEKAKGALITARFAFLREMDAPSSFFFNLEQKVREKKNDVAFERCKWECDFRSK